MARERAFPLLLDKHSYFRKARTISCVEGVLRKHNGGGDSPHMDSEKKHIKVICCYAHEDQSFLNELKEHLSPLQQEGHITFWADIDIVAGTDREQALHTSLDTAQIILLLVSHHFIASDYCSHEEMKHALKRYQCGEAIVIPIIVSPVYWQVTPLRILQALPEHAEAITSSKWNHPNDAYYNVVMGLREILNARKSGSLPTLLTTPQATPISFKPHLPPHFFVQGKKSPLLLRWAYVLLILLIILAVGITTATSLHTHNQDTLLTQYEVNINDLISKHDLPHSQVDAPVRSQARNVVNDALKQLDDAHKSSFVHFLAGTQLINGEPDVQPIIVFNGVNLENVDFSGLELRIVYFWGADLRGTDFRQAISLQGVDLQNANLQNAHITIEQLKAAWNLQDTILPDETHCPRYTNLLFPDGNLLDQVKQRCLSHYHPPS